MRSDEVDVRWPTVRRPARPGDVVHLDAAELSVAVARRLVSCVEVMTAYLDHIDTINPHVNAIVSLRPREELLAEAAGRDRELATGAPVGWMHGFPLAVKDLADVAGIPTCAGFLPPGAAPVPTVDDLHVHRMRAAGAIVIGKTNTPQFGLGSHTFNDVFGTTGNAYDPARSAGGSSGGAAVAVALRMLPVADGSDFMGSLRNPPGWNNVYGLRPSVGRVPTRGELFVDLAGVVGPIARTPLDLALLLATMAGHDAGVPSSLDTDRAQTVPGADASVTGRRVAWLGDLDGYLPMEPEVLATVHAARARFAELGVEVTDTGLPTYGTVTGTAELWPTWLTYRHWLCGGGLAPLIDAGHRERLKPEARYEYDGLVTGADGNPPVTGLDVYRASQRRSDLFTAFQQLFEHYDYAVLPTAQVMPFDAALRWPAEIAGVPMSSYHRWMEVSTIATLIGAPALAMPAGFGTSGLPIGLQVIGRPRGERALLELAQAWHTVADWTRRLSPLLGASATAAP